MQNSYFSSKNYGKELFKIKSTKAPGNTTIDIINKSLDILEERYKNKLISAEEYQKKAKELVKEKEKYLKDQNII